jgi:hypothetical protein
MQQPRVEDDQSPESVGQIVALNVNQAVNRNRGLESSVGECPVNSL